MSEVRGQNSGMVGRDARIKWTSPYLLTNNLFQPSNLRAIFVKLPALKGGELPGKEDKHFCIAPLDPALKDGACREQAGQTFEEYIKNPKVKVIILRHDVDRLPGNSLKTALLENELGIRATYFFRTIPQTFKPEIIKEIADLGHEIGYHYEDMDLSSRGQRSEVRSQKELDDSAVFDKAIKSFGRNLEKLRKLCPVKTICMHGSPLSKWDNRDLWIELATDPHRLTRTF